MVVNSRGKAISQRNEPKLALVHVDLPNEAFAEDWQAPEDSFMGILHLLRVLLCKQFSACLKTCSETTMKSKSQLTDANSINFCFCPL